MAAGAKNRLSVMGAGTMVAIGVVIWLLWPTGENVADIMKPFGYLEMVPPSNLHGPGTINTIEVVSDNKITLHPTCEIDAQILANLTQESHTVDHSLLQKLNKRLNISAQLKKIISSEIADNQAKDVFISFKDVKILTMSDESLHELEKKLISENCQEVIVRNIQHGGIVCQTQAVLEADVIYKIVYKDNVSVSERGKLTANVASKFQIDAAQDRVDEIIGKRLFYGVRLAPYGILLNRPDAQPADCRV